jgi:hypothetical protein
MAWALGVFTRKGMCSLLHPNTNQWANDANEVALYWREVKGKLSLQRRRLLPLNFEDVVGFPPPKNLKKEHLFVKCTCPRFQYLQRLKSILSYSQVYKQNKNIVPHWSIVSIHKDKSTSKSMEEPDQKPKRGQSARPLFTISMFDSATHSLCLMLMIFEKNRKGKACLS